MTASLGDNAKLSEASAGVRIGLNGVPLLARSPLKLSQNKKLGRPEHHYPFSQLNLLKERTKFRHNYGPSKVSKHPGLGWSISLVSLVVL